MSDRSLDLPYREREINGIKYRATTLNLEDWAALSECLAGLLGEPMAAILRGDSVLRADLVGSDMQYLIAGLAGKINKGKIMEICGHMAKGLRADDHILTSQQQYYWWPRHMRDLAPSIALFLEAQYSDFFEGLGASLPQARPDPSDPSEKGND